MSKSLDDAPFSDAWEHGRLSRVSEYAGTADFLKVAIWNGGNQQSRLLNKNGRATLGCIVTGMVSADGAQLESHGNFNPTVDTLKDTTKAKNVFFLTKPDPDSFPDLAGGWDVAVKNFKILQTRIAKFEDEEKHKHFLADHKIKGQEAMQTLKMNWGIFEKKPTRSASESADVKQTLDEREKLSKDYNVNSSYADDFEKTKKDFWATPLPVFMVNGERVRPADVHDRLIGSLVRVTFHLYWYNFGRQDYDTFTARVQHVVILKEGDVMLPISLTSKPRLPPQTSIRQEQAMAAKAFLPPLPSTPTKVRGGSAAEGTQEVAGSNAEGSDASPSKLMRHLDIGKSTEVGGASPSSTATLESTNGGDVHGSRERENERQGEESESPRKKQKRTHDEL